MIWFTGVLSLLLLFQGVRLSASALTRRKIARIGDVQLRAFAESRARRSLISESLQGIAYCLSGVALAIYTLVGLQAAGF